VQNLGDKGLIAPQQTPMEPERDTKCPHCAELWKRLDKLTEEKAQAQKKQGAQLVLSILLFMLVLAGLIVSLLSR
jgi:hypothetical protein